MLYSVELCFLLHWQQLGFESSWASCRPHTNFEVRYYLNWNALLRPFLFLFYQLPRLQAISCSQPKQFRLTFPSNCTKPLQVTTHFLVGMAEAGTYYVPHCTETPQCPYCGHRWCSRRDWTSLYRWECGEGVCCNCQKHKQPVDVNSKDFEVHRQWCHQPLRT